MTNLTKTEVEKLISYLAPMATTHLEGTYKQGQCLIGDVLHALYDHAETCGIPGKNLYFVELSSCCVGLWKPLGFKASLQEIVFKSGYEHIGTIDRGTNVCEEVDDCLKDPKAQELMNALYNIFKEQIQ
jgi:hypothetical protein